MTVSQAKIDAYQAWLKQNGVVMPPELKVTQVQWGTGVRCTKPLPEPGYVEEAPGERPHKKRRTEESQGTEKKRVWWTMKIPFSILLHPKFQPEMKVLRKELKKKSELWQSLLASQVLKVELNLVVIYWYMARERKNPQSRWTPYLDILPETYTTPIYWTKEELAEIEGTNLHAGTEQIHEMLRNMFKLIKASGDELIELRDLYWAYSAFSSRAAGTSLKDNTNEYLPPTATEFVVPCLVPLVDTFNHDPETKVKFITDLSENVFRYECDYDPSAGSEVFNNYGNKTNEAFILSYGFLLPDNSYSTCWVQLALSQADPLYATKKTLFLKLGLSLRHHITKDSVPPELLTAVRILLLDQVECYFFDESQKDFVSVRNEAQMYEALLNMIAEKRAKIGNIEGEISSLGPSCSYHREMALRYRFEQKTILTNAISLLSQQRIQFSESTRDPENVSQPLLKQLTEPSKFQHCQNWIKKIDPTNRVLTENNQLLLVSDSKSLSIPEEYLISTTRMSEDAEFSRLFTEPISSFEEDFLLCLFLIFEKHKGEKSKWFHFFESLPEELPNALQYTNLEVFENTPLLLGSIKEQDEELNELFYMNMKPLYKKLPQAFPETMYSKKNLKWALSILIEFSCVIGIDPGISGLTIIPIYPGKFNPGADVKWNFDINERVLVHKMNSTTFEKNYSNKCAEDMISLHGIFIPGEEETEILEGEGNGAEHFLRPGVYPETLVRALQVCLPPGETFIVRQGEAGEDEFEVEEEVTGTAHEGVVQIQEMKEEKDEEQERSEGILKLLVTLLSSCKVDNLDEITENENMNGLARLYFSQLNYTYDSVINLLNS